MNAVVRERPGRIHFHTVRHQVKKWDIQMASFPGNVTDGLGIQLQLRVVHRRIRQGWRKVFVPDGAQQNEPDCLRLHPGLDSSDELFVIGLKLRQPRLALKRIGHAIPQHHHRRFRRSHLVQ